MPFPCLFLSVWHLILYIIFSVTPVLAETQFEETPTPAQSYLKILKNESEPNFRFKHGENLRIEASGKYLEKIKEEIENNDTGINFKLFFDDIPMEGLDVAVIQPIEEDSMILSFTIIRDSRTERNRIAWDKLLKKQSDGYLMKPQVTMAVGNDIAWKVSSDEPFQLFIVTTIAARFALIVSVAFFFIAYRWLIHNPSALREFKNGPYSLGRSQMAFWGLLLILAFSSIWLLTGTMERIPDQALVLLGISGATGLSSIAISTTKSSKNESTRRAEKEKLEQKIKDLLEKKQLMPDRYTEGDEKQFNELTTELQDASRPAKPQPSEGFWKDICNDGNGTSVHRLQVVLWTILLGMVFVKAVAQSMSIPEFSETLLLLLGISNGIYLGFKFPETK